VTVIPARVPRVVWLRRALRLAALACVELVAFVWFAIAAASMLVGAGGYLVPSAFAALRRATRQQRRLALEYTGVRVVESYAPLPGGDGFGARWRRAVAQLRDRAALKDVWFSLLDPVVGLLLALVPIALILNAVWGIVLMFVWPPVVDAGGTEWFLFVPVSDQRTAVTAAVVGVGFGILGWFLARTTIVWHGRWVRAMLSPSPEDLERRVEELSQSRADVVDDASAEVRRIERDLHDGAQARIVAMGMTLTTAERLVETDPDAARAMIAEAKVSSSAALQELRDLVRGIHPPVLADRGLVDAVRSLAIEAPVPVTVTSTLDARLSEPVESAVYFAVSELLTNVAKHARASAVTVDVARDEQGLVVVVSDDGVGGASAAGGTGLRGIERRLGAFDGTLRLVSPVGGPTVATVRVPLAG
jgi:signal transduction histidine kinase